MKAEAHNLVRRSNALAEVLCLPPAVREHFAQFLRNLADAIESGGQPLSECNSASSQKVASPCTDCKDKCERKEPCAKLEAFLPSVTQGRGCKENTTGLHVETLKDYTSTRRLEIFQQFQSCDAPFTDKQWKVICLYYGEGLTQDQIARTTGKKRSAISGLLKRARDLKKRHFEHMREKVFVLRKEQMRNHA